MITFRKVKNQTYFCHWLTPYSHGVFGGVNFRKMEIEVRRIIHAGLKKREDKGYWKIVDGKNHRVVSGSCRAWGLRKKKV